MLSDAWLVPTDSLDLTEQLPPSLELGGDGWLVASPAPSLAPLPALDRTMPEPLQELDELDLEDMHGERSPSAQGIGRSPWFKDSLPELLVATASREYVAVGAPIEGHAESASLWFEPRAVSASQPPPVVSSPRATITAFALTAATVISYLVLSGGEPSAKAEPSGSSPASSSATARADDGFAQGPRVPKPVTTRAPTPTPTLASVSISSKDGAVVTLVDNGRAVVLGATPVSATIDPSREYDLIVTKPGAPTRILHLDRAVTKHGAIDLDARPGAN
jgi:hypothetical protein